MKIEVFEVQLFRLTWQNVVSKISIIHAEDVPTWRILSNAKIGIPTAKSNSRADRKRRLPDHLSEMTSVHAKAWIVEIVIIFLAVPGIHAGLAKI